MAPGPVANRPLRANPKLPPEGSFVEFFRDGKKVKATVVSQDKNGITLSERSSYGPPKRHTISDTEGILVVEQKLKTAPYRKDALDYVDPYRTRSLESENRFIGAQNQLSFSVESYDAKSDQFFVQSSINGDHSNGKWLNARDLYPLLDGSLRSVDTGPDSLIQRLAGLTGQTSALKARTAEKKEEVKTETDEGAKKEVREERQDPGEAANKKEDAATSAKESETSSKRIDDDEEEPPTQDGGKPANLNPSIPLAASILASSLPANNVAAAADPKSPFARPEERRSDRMESRLAELKQKKTSTGETGSSGKTSSETGQMVRERIVLNDATLVHPEILPPIIRQYATASGVNVPAIDGAAWRQALQQAEAIQQHMSERIRGREQQYHTLEQVGAPTALLQEAATRINALQQARNTALGTIRQAQGKRSAGHLASFQRSSAGGASSSQEQTGQHALETLRVQIGQTGEGAQGGGSGISLAFAIPAISPASSAHERDFEQLTLDAIDHAQSESQTELANLQAQLGTLQANLEQALANQDRNALSIQNQIRDAQKQLSDLRDELDTLDGERDLQQARLDEMLESSIARGSQNINPDTDSGDILFDNAPAEATPSATSLLNLRPDGGSEREPSTGAANPFQSRSPGSQFNAPIPVSSGSALKGEHGKPIKQPTTALGGQPSGSKPLTLKPLQGMGGGGGGAVAEAASLNRDQQRDRRSGGGRPKGRSVLDVPSVPWANPSTTNDDSEEGDEERTPSMSEQNEEMRDRVDQLQDNPSDEEDEGGGGDDSSASSMDGEEGARGRAQASEMASQEEAEGEGGYDEGSQEGEEDVAGGSSVGANAVRAAGAQPSLRNTKNFSQWLSSQAREQAAEAEKTSSSQKEAKFKAERLLLLEKEAAQKLVDITGLAGFEAIVPVLTYVGRVYISAVNRRAGFFSMTILPGYRPQKPRGMPDVSLEKSWDMLLDFEVMTVTFALFACFMFFLGICIFMFMYIFGPLVAIIDAFEHLFS